MNGPRFSVLICTRNRAEGLEITLDGISKAAERAESLEAIIVNNGSTDETGEVVERWKAKQPFPVIVVEEDKAGLSHARNAGIAVATGEIVVMTDDDCIPNDDYFEKIDASFNGDHQPQIVGGRIELGDDKDLPITIKLEPVAKVLDYRQYPAGFVMGANLAISRDVFSKVGVFDTRFGAGARYVSAEDTDFLLRSSRSGVGIRYDPTFAVRHFHGRRAYGEAVHLSKGYYMGDGAVYAKHLLKDRRILRFIKTDIRNMINDARSGYTSPAGIKRFGVFKIKYKFLGAMKYMFLR